MKNHLDVLLKEAKRTTQGDNRTRAVKNLNMLIELGIKIVICEKNYMWTTKKGFDYNFKLTYGQRSNVWLIKERNFNAYNMLVLAGRFLKRPEVKEQMYKDTCDSYVMKYQHEDEQVMDPDVQIDETGI